MAQTQLDRVYVQAIDGAGDGINSLSIGTKSLTTRVNIGGLGTDSNSIQINGAGTTITGPVAMGIVTAANTTITNASITNLGVTANASMTNVSIHTLSVVGQTTLANVGVAGQTTLQNTSVNGTLRVDGQSTLINVSATSLTSSSLTILNNVSMGGNVSIGSLFVSSNLVLPSGSNTVLANASINGTLRADGVTTLKEVTLQNASINLNTRMDGSLTVLGATEFYNTVAARGASNTFTVEGQTTLSNTSIQGLTVTGTVNVSTNITGILQNTYNLGIGRGIITNNVIDNFAGGDLSLRNKPLNSLHVADVSNTIIRIGPMGYQGTAANTTEYGLERSRHSIVFSGFRDQQQDLIGTKISSINKQTYGGGTQQLIQSSDLAFFTMAPGLVPMITDITTERMRIMDGGNVGIGITIPTALLDVNGSLVYSTAATRSDRRIKTDILDVEDQQALIDLRRLKPKTYGYKDSKERGNERVYGFIAQEVKEVLNYAGDLTKDYIPNIYEHADFVNDILTFTTFNTSSLERDASGDIFTKLKVKTNDLKNEYLTIVEVLDEHTLKVDTNSWSKDASGQLICPEHPFVYGQEVDNFNTLNKDAIWTVATAALQEVDRQLQSEKQKTATLETTLASTQATLASCQETLAALVARLDALEQR